ARDVSVIAVDISEDMLAEVRKRYGMDTRGLQLLRSDAECLDLPDGSVDHVLSWRLFHLLPLEVIERVLREFRRVSRGEIVVEVMSVHPGTLRNRALAILKAGIRTVWGSKAAPGGTVECLPWSHIASYTHPEW